MKSRNLILSYVLSALCLVCLSVGFTFAEETPSVEKVTYASPQSEKKALVHFRSALDAFRENNIRTFEEKLSLVQTELYKSKFANAPIFSLELLRLAGKRTGYPLAGTQINNEHLIDWAVKLSPTHPDILFLAASTHDFSSVLDSLKYVARACFNLLSYPFSFLSVVSRLALVTIIATFVVTYLSLLLLFAIRVSEVLSAVGAVFPKKVRPVMSLGIYLFLLFIPTFSSLTLAMALWSLALAYSIVSLRLLPLIVSAVLMVVHFAPPEISKVMVASDSGIAKALQNGRMRDYSMLVSKGLNDGLKIQPDDPLLLSLQGQLSLQHGKLQEASDFYKRAYHNATHDKGLEYVSNSSLALITYRMGDKAAAYKKFQKLYEEGWREYELLTNLSILAIEVFDEAQYKIYYQELQELYGVQSSNQGSSQSQLLIPQIPRSLLYSFVSFLQEHPSSEQSKIALRYQVPDPEFPVIFICAGLCLFSVLLVGFRVGHGYRVRSTLQFERPVLFGYQSWLRGCTPGYEWIQSNKPMKAIVALVPSVAVIFLSIGMPIGLHMEQEGVVIPLLVIGCLVFLAVQAKCVRSHGN